MTGHRAFRLAVRLALLAHPPAARDRDGGEMEAVAVAAYAERRRRGAAGGWSFAVRVLADLVRSGARSRAETRRERGGGGIMGWHDAWTDVRVAARTLRRSPGFVLASVGVLGLGIGVNTALFSAVRATLLAHPPFPDHERLVVLSLSDSSTARPGPPRDFPWSYPKFRLLEDMDLPLERAAAYARRSVTLTGAGDAAYLTAEYVTPGYLEVLGVTPVAGRAFLDIEDEEGAPLVAVLGHALWRERFGGDPALVGRDVVLNGRPVTVVGVAPAGFRGLTGQAELWVPVRTGAEFTARFLATGAHAHWLVGIGRVTPGTDIGVLDARMREVGRVVEETYPDTDPTVVRGGTARSLAEARVNPQARTSLLVLSAAAALLLLVACANLAALLVARASARVREAAVRIALGAGRWRVARTFLAEALLLSVGGGVAGVVMARVGLDALAALWPRRFVDASWNVRAAGVDAVGLDPWVLAFAALVAVGTGLLFGVVPALGVGFSDPAARLRGGVEGGARPGRRWDLKSLLVAGEMGTALVLLVGAGLLLRSLGELQDVDRGFEAEGLVTFNYVIPRGSRWSDDPAAFHARALERFRGLPGVEGAALGCAPPLTGHCMITGVHRAGERTWSEGTNPPIGVHMVSDDFFRVLGVPVLQGRTFTSEDQADSRPVVVLSQRAAEELFPDGDALGRTVGVGVTATPEDGPGAEVVGVVADVLFDRPANGVMAEAFFSYRQAEGGETVFLRTRGEPLASIPGVRAALAELDPDMPVFSVRTVADLEADASGDTRILGILLTAFAGLALLLACAGVWSVVAFAVARRTREIGVRVALGADPGRVVRTVVRQGLALSLAGLVVGGGGAWAATRLLRGVLYGVGPSDPQAFLGAAVVLLGVATLASWLPARHATRVDPMVALRAD